MIKITVMGKTFEINAPKLSNVNVTQNEVIINGKRVTSFSGNDRNIEVHIHGDVDGDVRVHGSCRVQGNVGGMVDAGGSVQCGDVGQSVDAGGSVQSSKVGGNIDAGGSVSVS